MLAIHHGQYDVVDELLRQGAKVDIPNDSEKTLLDLAEQQSNFIWEQKHPKSQSFFYSIIFDWIGKEETV